MIHIHILRLLVASFCLFHLQWGFSQETVVTGRVLDKYTGDPVPFANVIFKGTNSGATTDFVGYYKMAANSSVDSVIASYIGYKTQVKPVKSGQSQEINFQLEEDIRNLEEVVFVAEENPAFAIMRKAIARKQQNDMRSLEAYQYESYNKIEVALDNLTEKFRSRKIVQKVKQVIDSIDRIAGEEGEAVLPIFVSESLSKFYYRDNPELRKEHILNTKITGIGIQDGSIVSQFIGSTFQQYNFYQNWLNIWEKEFVSPLADGWKTYYNVYLIDSLDIDGHFVYRIDVEPKRKGDLAFNGTIWITKKEYALKQIDVWVDEAANLNYIEKLKIQQELFPTSAGPWIPSKSRILTDFQLIQEFGFGKQAAGVLAKFYTSNKDYVINQPRDPRFYDLTLEVAEDAFIYDEDFWTENRHDPLTSTERNVIRMIDTLKQIKPVKRISDLITYLASGYITVGKFDYGPYLLTYAFNNIEGHRVRVGGRTNWRFSDKMEFKGYLAYGSRDNEFKYGAGIDYIFSKKPWTEIGFYSTKDIQQIGLTFDDLYGPYNLIAFEAYFRNIDHTAPYLLRENRFHFQREMRKGLQQKVTLRHKEFEPIFNFAFLENPELEENSPLTTDFTTTEITLETRYGKDELWIQLDNNRLSLGPTRAPVYTARYTVGVDNLLNSDFTYHEVSLNIFQRLRLGLFGVSSYSLTGGKIFNQVPLPLLKGHIGNESPFYIPIAFNLMNFSEFVSDSYVSLNYLHRFEGFILNRIPLFKKLKWRLVGTANVLAGNVRDENIKINAPVDQQGVETLKINILDSDVPYAEVGYGIENIFKIGRIDFFHRLTYLDLPDVDKFGVKFSLQFVF